MKKILSIVLAMVVVLMSLSGCKGVALDESKNIISSIDTKVQIAQSSINKLEKRGVVSTDIKIQFDKFKSEYDNLKSKVEDGDLNAIVEITTSLKGCEEKINKLQETIQESMLENGVD